MLRDCDTPLLASCAPDCNLFFTPVEQTSNAGRPSGGLGIFVNKRIKVILNLFSSINKRVSYVLLEYGGIRFVAFNVYLPCLAGTDFNEAELYVSCEFITDTILEMDTLMLLIL